MKRFIIGILSLGGLVGGGSTGLYFAYDKFAAAAPEAVEADVPSAARDMRPTPIPLAASEESEPASRGNPFARTASTTRAAAEERYPTRQTSFDAPEGDSAQPADEPQTVNRYEDSSTAQRGGPLGQADQQPAGEQEPVRADQPARAEQPRELAPVEVDNEREPLATQPVEEEPRALRAGPAAENVDRYSRPVRPRFDAEPARDEPQGVAAPAAVTPTEEGTGRPGDPKLSGTQAPTLTIEKLAPAEIQIGKPAKFLIKVTNTGAVTANGVEVHDSVPQGTQLIESSPNAKRGARGTLIWELGALKPGDEHTVEVQLMPTAEGEIGSVATVHFAAQASVRTVSTKPMLSMQVTGPERVLKGQAVLLRIKLSNPGTGAATGIVLSESVPEALSHESGGELEFEVGTLKPGEVKELELELKAVAAGMADNVIIAQGEGTLRAEARAEVDVVAPQLQVAMTGPKRRYLERNATHTISISNPGTATAKDIELVAVLPKELKFVEANNGGQFDAATHSVYWGLEELPPQETGTVTLTTLPLAAGEVRVAIKSAAQMGLKDEREEVVTIEGLAAINFNIADKTGPIEVGGQSTYEIKVSNQGSKAATNVRVAAVVPRELKLVSADGPVRYKIEAQQIIFEPLRTLAPKTDVTFSVTAQALAAGDLRVQVQLASDDLRDPITKEENTRVFGNE